MKLKITPLNVVSAAGLVVAGLLLTNNKVIITATNTGWLVIFSLIMALMAFLADQIFRKFVPSLFKTWLLQLAFISFTILLIWMLKTWLF